MKKARAKDPINWQPFRPLRSCLNVIAKWTSEISEEAILDVSDTSVLRNLRNFNLFEAVNRGGGESVAGFSQSRTIASNVPSQAEVKCLLLASDLMSLTVQQILSDAKRLVSRLRDHDTTADNLISQAQNLHKQVDAMKQYQEDVADLNTVAGQRPRSQLVLGIQQENRHLRALQQENRELRTLLEEHQSALELIMTKYRQHIVKLLEASKAEQNFPTNDNSQALQERADKICEMAAVMAQAIAMDDVATAKEHEKLTQLVTENRGLRELLQISCKSGSLQHPFVAAEMEDKDCQTDS